MNVLRFVLEIKDRRDFWVEPMKKPGFKERCEILRKFLRKVERLKPSEEKVWDAETCKQN